MNNTNSRVGKTYSTLKNTNLKQNEKIINRSKDTPYQPINGLSYITRGDLQQRTIR